MSDVSVKDGVIDVSGLAKYAEPLERADTVIENASHGLTGAPRLISPRCRMR